jgi:hypothetical protein
MTIQNEIKRSGFPLAATAASGEPHLARWQRCRYSVAVADGLMAAIERIPAHCSCEDVQERLWEVIWKASLSARRAKPGCSRIVFEVTLPIEGTMEKYHTLILNMRSADMPDSVGIIGFPADFYNVALEVEYNTHLSK